MPGHLWVEHWASKFPTRKYPAAAYAHLLEAAPDFKPEDFVILGAWKDGARCSFTLTDNLCVGTNSRRSSSAASCRKFG